MLRDNAVRALRRTRFISVRPISRTHFIVMNSNKGVYNSAPLFIPTIFISK